VAFSVSFVGARGAFVCEARLAPIN
jgi:hypothetical protein